VKNTGYVRQRTEKFLITFYYQCVFHTSAHRKLFPFLEKRMSTYTESEKARKAAEIAEIHAREAEANALEAEASAREDAANRG
jgi:hypothetical protein